MSTYVKSPLNTEIIMKWFKMTLSSQLPLAINILLHYTSIKGTAAGDGKEEHHVFNNSSFFCSGNLFSKNGGKFCWVS
jgi:predicted metal-binding membrane protein